MTAYVNTGWYKLFLTISASLEFKFDSLIIILVKNLQKSFFDFTWFTYL